MCVFQTAHFPLVSSKAQTEVEITALSAIYNIRTCVSPSEK
jgi:hypothetical protein